MIKEKYQDVLDLGLQLKVKNGDVREEGGKLYVKGQALYQFDKDRIWNKIKEHPNWQNEIAADITVERTDIYGIYTVQPGDTLSKLAKLYLDSPNRYMDIFNLNKDVLTNPDLIKVGQQLKLPNR
ncbi:MAG: LysM peptidoglycan-binding domain-containing protein [Acidobacteriota bacterium]